jgi:anti-sigma B factor antagonist
MNIEVRRRGAIALVRPDGRITIGAHSARFRAALDRAIDEGASHVVVDGSAVAYLDSSGIGEMVAAMRRLMPAGGCLGIVAPSPKLREILEITGLVRVFVVGEEEDGVIERLPPLDPVSR